MTKLDKSRRAFLAGAGAGALASTAFGAGALAQEHATAGTAGQSAESGGTGYGAFLNDTEAATVAAIAERLMPGEPGKPGATDAGVLNYIDLALAGAYSEWREFYRHGLAQLDSYCRATYQAPFRQLDVSRQDETIAALETGQATGFAWPAARAFFDMLHRHTMEGMFADPIYGGNKNFAGWELIGFPGAQMLYTRTELQGTRAFSRAPIMGLQAQTKSLGGRN